MVDVDTAPRVAPGAPSLAGEAPACRLQPPAAAAPGGAVPTDEERAVQVRPSRREGPHVCGLAGCPPRLRRLDGGAQPDLGWARPGTGAPPGPLGPQDGIATWPASRRACHVACSWSRAPLMANCRPKAQSLGDRPAVEARTHPVCAGGVLEGAQRAADGGDDDAGHQGGCAGRGGAAGDPGCGRAG